MRNKSSFILTFLCAVTLYSTNVFALDSDLIYGYTTENKEEFVITGKSGVNINGEIPDYLRDIYDITPQSVYGSEYGANVITPQTPGATQITYAPTNAPVPSYMAGPTGLVSGAAQDGGQSSGYTADISTGGTVSNNSNLKNNSNNQIPDSKYSYNTDWEDDNNKQYPLTSIEQVRNDDGSIGVLRIPEIDLKVTAYDGDTFAVMKKGIGHISSTSVWSGNIGMVGHNRGTSDYFGKLKKLEIGDEMTYKTNLGTRTYVVKSITTISDTDWSKLSYTSDNRLTLITCVEDVGDNGLMSIK